MRGYVTTTLFCAIGVQGTLRIALTADGAFNFDVYLAKNPEHQQALLKFYQVPADAPTIHVPRSNAFKNILSKRADFAPNDTYIPYEQ